MAEGAIDRNGNKITCEEVKRAVVEELKQARECSSLLQIEAKIEGQINRNFAQLGLSEHLLICHFIW